MAWVRASMPVEAVSGAGRPTIMAGSLKAMVGVILAVAKIIFTWVSVLVITAKRVTSLPVPAVVLTAMNGGSGLGTVSIPAKSRISPLLVATIPIPLAQSC